MLGTRTPQHAPRQSSAPPLAASPAMCLCIDVHAAGICSGPRESHPSRRPRARSRTPLPPPQPEASPRTELCAPQTCRRRHTISCETPQRPAPPLVAYLSTSCRVGVWHRMIWWAPTGVPSACCKFAAFSASTTPPPLVANSVGTPAPYSRCSASGTPGSTCWPSMHTPSMSRTAATRRGLAARVAW